MFNKTNNSSGVTELVSADGKAWFGVLPLGGSTPVAMFSEQYDADVYALFRANTENRPYVASKVEFRIRETAPKAWTPLAMTVRFGNRAPVGAPPESPQVGSSTPAPPPRESAAGDELLALARQNTELLRERVKLQRQAVNAAPRLRQLASIAAMQGLLSFYGADVPVDRIAELSVEAANALREAYGKVDVLA